MTFDAIAASEAVFNAMNWGLDSPITKLTPAMLQNLTAFADVQYVYGQNIGVMDPGLYAYEALGAALSGLGSFINPLGTGSQSPGGVSDQQFLNLFYQQAFGQQPSNLQLEAFQFQLTFLEGLYAHAGFQPNPNWPGVDVPELVARGAVAGLMVGVEAEIQIVGQGASHAQI